MLSDARGAEIHAVKLTELIHPIADNPRGDIPSRPIPIGPLGFSA
jgi:hypothetical protein